MKSKHLTLLFLLVAQFAAGQNQWTWINGEQSNNINGIYGTRGLADPSNIPGSRMGSSTWVDAQGNLWLFGGRGYGESGDGYLNDLWRYNHATNEWTWIAGEKTVDQSGTYGLPGLPFPTNYPGARQNAVTWTDENGIFWMFGGAGFGSGNEPGLLNDLWRFSPTTRIWTWVSGDNGINQEGTYGRRTEPSLFTRPGSRFGATSFTDNDGNLWLFGGRGYSSDNDISDLNDVWKFSPQSGQWTWMKGDNEEDADDRYGRKGEFDERNTPGGRRGSTGWTDGNGNFWMFAGNSQRGFFGDLWQYNTSTNEWAWISGSRRLDQEPSFVDEGVPDVDNNPGGRTFAAGWTVTPGELWLFGGTGYGRNDDSEPLNNLWRYNIANSTWTFFKGDATLGPDAVYGTKGVSATANTPGGTSNPSAWTDAPGNLWIFGGQSPSGILNQTWRFQIKCGSEISGTISPASSSICEGGSQVLTATGGTGYEWFLDGEIIAGETKATLTATQPGTYSVLIYKTNCSAPASNTATITLATAPTGTISPAAAIICEGGSQVLTATGGTSYQWRRNGILLGGQTKSTFKVTEPGTYNVDITNGGCTGPASNESIITLQSNPAQRYPDTTIAADTPVQLNARNIGETYSWTPVTGLDDPSSRTPILTTSTGGEYLVEITTKEGCKVTDTQLVKMIGDTTTEPPPPPPPPPPPAGEKKIGYVPTAFTPDGNNQNDLLRPLGNLQRLDYFKVYNRWGNLMFETTQMGAGWDGRFKGVMQPADTYTWVLVGTDANSQPIKQSGKALLIR